MQPLATLEKPVEQKDANSSSWEYLPKVTVVQHYHQQFTTLMAPTRTPRDPSVSLLSPRVFL